MIPIIPVLGASLIGAVAYATRRKKTAPDPSVYSGDKWDDDPVLPLPPVEEGTREPVRTKGAKIEKLTSKDKFMTMTFDGSHVLESPYLLLEQLERKLGRRIGITALTIAMAITAEAGTLPRMARIGIGWTAMNAARRRKLHPVFLMTPDGWFGRQGAKWGRPYLATSKPTTLQDLLLAEGIISGRIPDPTKGSINFDSPRTQRALLGRKAGYVKAKTPEQIAFERMQDGLAMVTVPGVPADVQRFWRPVG